MHIFYEIIMFQKKNGLMYFLSHIKINSYKNFRKQRLLKTIKFKKKRMQ